MKIFFAALFLAGCASPQQPVASAAPKRSLVEISSAQNIASVIAPKPTPFSEPAEGLYWSGTDSGGGFNIYYGVASHSYSWMFHTNGFHCAIPVPYLGARYFFAATSLDTNGMESDFSNELSDVVDQNSSRIFRFYLSQPMQDSAVQKTTDLYIWSPVGDSFRVATNANNEDWFVPASQVSTFYRLEGTPQ